MNFKEYHIKKKELEFLITVNEKVRCHRVANKWRRELNKLEQRYKEEEDGRTTDA